MIYAMSDIHGFLDIFQENVRRIDLSGENRLILLGDYIDFGPQSGQTLRYVYDLQQQYGPEKVVVLRGNHEEAFLEWLKAYSGPRAGKPDRYGLVPWNDWLDADPGYGTFRSLVTEGLWKRFQQAALSASQATRNIKAAQMVLFANSRLIRWLSSLPHPYYYETQRQIFVHAGIEEKAGDWWKHATAPHVFTGKYPWSTGSFDKDIIAGHIGTARISGDPDYHGMYHDGQSHYYIDGTVNESGRIPILVYDEKSGEYWEE